MPPMGQVATREGGVLAVPGVEREFLRHQRQRVFDPCSSGFPDGSCGIIRCHAQAAVQWGRSALDAGVLQLESGGVLVYLVLLIAVAVAVTRARNRIEQVEGLDRRPELAPSRSERWKQAPGMEKAAFVVLALSAAVWLLLILPIGFAAAAVALGLAVWKRPYLEATLAPVVLIGGAVIAVYDLLLPLVRNDMDWGAALVNTALFGGLWILVGVLLRAAGRSPTASGNVTAHPVGP